MPSSGPNGGATSAGSGATAAGESGSAGGASTAGGSTSSPDGAITAGDSKTSCIYVRYANLTFEPALTAAEQATGVTFNCLTTYIDATTTWQEWEVPWIDDPGYAFTGWEAADPSHRTLVLATDLVPTSVDEPNGSPDPQAWESACAAGDDNGHATALAQNLVASGFGNAVIRLGLEMNGNWEPDYAGTTAAEQHQWAACFAQEVGAMRSVSGAHFLFDWNVNACVDDDVLSNLYPGNAYVDIIGIDAYDAFCNGSAPSASASSFQALAAEPDGLNAVTAFAEQQGKPMSLPEWGTVATAANGGFGLGDDGFYVSGIGQWVASHDVAFQSYFDHDSSSILPLATSEPNTLSAYRAAFS